MVGSEWEVESLVELGLVGYMEDWARSQIPEVDMEKYMASRQLYFAVSPSVLAMPRVSVFLQRRSLDHRF